MHDDAIFSWQVQLSSFNITLPSMSVVCFSSLIISGIRFTIPRYIEFKLIACFYLNISASYVPSKSTVQINCNHVAMQTLCNSLCAYKTKKGR